MSADEWLTENGIDPDSVSQNLKSLLTLCDNPEYADRLRDMLRKECSHE